MNQATNNATPAACPFCGSEAKVFGALHAWAVNCTGCDSYGPSTSKYEAITAWNRRATQASAEPVAYFAEDGEGNVGLAFRESHALRQCEAGATVTPLFRAPSSAPSTEPANGDTK